MVEPGPDGERPPLDPVRRFRPTSRRQRIHDPMAHGIGSGEWDEHVTFPAAGRTEPRELRHRAGVGQRLIMRALSH